MVEPTNSSNTMAWASEWTNRECVREREWADERASERVRWHANKTATARAVCSIVGLRNCTRKSSVIFQASRVNGVYFFRDFWTNAHSNRMHLWLILSPSLPKRIFPEKTTTNKWKEVHLLKMESECNPWLINNCLFDVCACVCVFWILCVLCSERIFQIQMEIPRAPNHALAPHGIQSLTVILCTISCCNQRHRQKFTQK